MHARFFLLSCSSMNLADASQAIFLAEWSTVFYLVLVGVIIITCLWLLRKPAHANSAPQPSAERSACRVQDRTPSPQRASLRQLYSSKNDPEDGPGTDIDIIAIHGL